MAFISVLFFVLGWLKVEKDRLQGWHWSLILVGLTMIGVGAAAMLGAVVLPVSQTRQIYISVVLPPMGSLITLFGMLEPVRWNLVFDG